MIKKNKGITLIALIITIIVLLILAVVSVNAVVGENGIIARTIESKLVTTIADIIFNIEDDIVDINIEDLANKVEKSSTEMINELIQRNIVKKPEDSDYDSVYSQLLQSEIIDNRLNGLYLSYNGDIWYENYKRGKIKLSKNTNTIYSKDTKTKITVIDGTIEETKDNEQYYLHVLKNRTDFACWINQYGQIVSTYPDTRIFITNPREEEYTAIYDKKLKRELLFNDRIIIGLESNIIKKDGRYYLEAQTTYNPHPVAVSYKIWNITNEDLKEWGYPEVDVDKLVLMYRAEKINNMGIYTSENRDYLIVNDDLGLNVDMEYFSNEDIKEGETEPIEIYRNFIGDSTSGKMTAKLVQGGYYVPFYGSVEQYEYNSFIQYINQDITDYINKYKEKGVKRLYYRGVLGYKLYDSVPIGTKLENGKVNFNFEKCLEDIDGNRLYTESVIKYIDID